MVHQLCLIPLKCLALTGNASWEAGCSWAKHPSSFPSGSIPSQWPHLILQCNLQWISKCLDYLSLWENQYRSERIYLGHDLLIPTLKSDLFFWLHKETNSPLDLVWCTSKARRCTHRELQSKMPSWLQFISGQAFSYNTPKLHNHTGRDCDCLHSTEGSEKRRNSQMLNLTMPKSKIHSGFVLFLALL